jgi:hypothetical protein
MIKMHTVIERANNDKSKRTLLFGFLVNCLLSEEAGSKCPLTQPRKALNIEQKYVYVMNLSGECLKTTLIRCKECYKQRSKYYSKK